MDEFKRPGGGHGAGSRGGFDGMTAGEQIRH
jgi:hypothetical protein